MTDEHKKILEDLFNCKLQLDYVNLCDETQYKLKFNNSNETIYLWYNKKANCFVVDLFFLNKIVKCNKLLVLDISFYYGYYGYFVFLDDLKNIDI